MTAKLYKYQPAEEALQRSHRWQSGANRLGALIVRCQPCPRLRS